MSNTGQLIRLRASSRALLSTLFQDPNPAIPQVERLESDLIKIESSLGRLKAAAVNEWHGPLDWGGFLDDLRFALGELPKALENVGGWGARCIEQFGRHVPVYTLLLDAALAAIGTNSSNSEPSTLAPSAGGTPFGNLGQAIEAFQNGANIAAPKSTTQLITSSDISCHEMQSDDGPLIWSRLCLDSRKVTRGGFTLGKRLSLAASWICAVKSARGRIQTTSSLRDATFDIHSIEKLDLANSQAFLDILKAAAILRQKDGYRADPPSNLTLLVARSLELEILGQINAFYQDVFDAPDYLRISDECNFDLSRSSLGCLKGEELTRLAQPSLPSVSLFGAPTSNQTQRSMLSGPRIESSHGSAETSSPSSPGPSKPRTRSRQEEITNWSHVVGILPETARPSHGRTSTPSSSHNDELVRDWDSDGLEVVPGNDSGLELATPSGTDWGSHSHNLSSPLVQQDSQAVLPYNDEHSAVAMTFHPDLINAGAGLMVTPIEHMNAETSLMVTMIEQEHFCSRVTELTLPGDEYEELFNESIKGNQPVQFYQDIECISRKNRGRDVHIPCKIRLFKELTTHARMLHIYTEFEGQLSKKLDHQCYRPNAQFVPKYAFDDENELPQAYIRCHESKMIHTYKFLPHERDESRTYLQGFQGAVLGLLFQGGYRLESLTRSRGLITKDEIMKDPSIQFWTDRKSHLENSSPSPASRSGSSSGISSPDMFTGRKARDLTHDDLDKFKNTLPCPRMFIYSKSPKQAIYMMFVDDRVELKQPPSHIFKQHGSEVRTVQIVACRNVSERFRVREIDGNIRLGIPLDLEGLHLKDQDLPAGGFQDVKSLSLVFHSDLVYQQFAQNFRRLQDVWYQELASYRQLRDRLKNPRVAIVVRPKPGEDGGMRGGHGREGLATLSL